MKNLKYIPGTHWADVVSGKTTVDQQKTPTVYGFAPVVHPSYSYSPSRVPRSERSPSNPSIHAGQPSNPSAIPKSISMRGFQQHCPLAPSGQSAFNLGQYGAGHQSDDIIPESEESAGRSRSSSRDGPVKVSFHLDSDDPGFASNSSDSGKAAGKTPKSYAAVCQHCSKAYSSQNPSARQRHNSGDPRSQRHDSQGRTSSESMCIATELILILPNGPDINLVMSQGVEAMTTGTVDGKVTNDGPVHLTASQVAQGGPKEDPMTEVGSPGETREAGVRKSEGEEESRDHNERHGEEQQGNNGRRSHGLPRQTAARDTTGVTATPAQGDATKISFALVEEGRTVAHILLRKAKVRRQVWREGPA